MDSILGILGSFLGEKFAKITMIFAQKGDVSADYDNLKKIEDKIKNVITSVNGYLSSSDIINTLTSTDSTKVLSAAQGKALNDSISTLSTNVGKKADSTNVYTKTETGSSADFTTAFNAAAGNIFNS